MVKNPKIILGGSFFVAWCFDFLFWNKAPGISFFIFIFIVLSAGLVLAWREGIKPAIGSLLLLIPILFFAVGTFVRKEPLTTVMNYLITLILLAIFAHTFRKGRWINYGLGDYVTSFFSLLLAALSRPIVAIRKGKPESEDHIGEGITKKSTWKGSLPYLRGLIIAIPILILFTSLLASADLVFAEYLNNFLGIFNLEDLSEYIFRGFYIVVMGYLIGGVYLHAFTNEKVESLTLEEKSWLPRFLGFPESVTVLGSVELIFTLFVGVQIRYFFGGQANINLQGFTYAEYARRGFGELIVVSVLSLILFLSLSSISKRENKFQKKVYSFLGVLLVFFLGVILVSAYQRLLLYEEAYGFTRLRTSAHLFMLWLGLLLVAVVILELLGNQRAFVQGFLFTAIGFILSLNLINVDGIIVNQNLKHATSINSIGIKEDSGNSDGLDIDYLYSLSSDAVPALVSAEKNPDLSKNVKGELAGILACHFVRIEDKKAKENWQSFNYADFRAFRLMLENQEYFRDVPTFTKNGLWWASVDGIDHACGVRYTGNE